MAKTTSADIERLAELSRIELSAAEKESFVATFDSILGYIDQIKQAAKITEGTPTIAADALRNVMRDDTNPHPSGAFTEKILQEAPARQGNYLKVKKIL